MADRTHSALFVVHGTDLPTARDARALFGHGDALVLLESINGVLDILMRGTPPSEVFTDQAETPHLWRLPADGDGAAIWTGLLVRMLMFVRLVAIYGDDAGLLVISERAFFQIFNEESHALVLSSSDLLAALMSPTGIGEADVTAFPVVKARGFLWTSAWMLADSIAPWLQTALERIPRLRQAVLSQALEDETVSLLRNHGFQAGRISESGTWWTQDGPISFAPGPKDAGEIDVLAVRSDGVFVIECKSVYSKSNLRNLVDRVTSLSSGYREQAHRKTAWVRDSLGLEVDLTLVVFEGAEYLSEQEAYQDVQVMSLTQLEEVLTEVDTSRSVEP